MISAEIKRVLMAFLIVIIALSPASARPFESLFSERTTLDGAQLSGEYDPRASCAVIEGMPTFHFIDNDFIPSNKITALCEDQYGNLFIGTRDTGVIKYTVIGDKRAVFNKFPVEDTKKHGQIAIHELAYNNREKRLYVATTGGLFYIVDDDDFSSASCRPVEVFGDKTITAMAISHSGEVWAGTAEGLFNTKGEHYSEADGLPGDRITTLLFDRHDNLCVGTETGLAIRRSGTFHTIDFSGREKLWITDLALTTPLEIMIPLEKYELIVKAFFTGIRLNPAYDEKERGEIDAMEQALLDVARPGSDSLLIATTDGFYQADPTGGKAYEVKEGWMHCTAFKDNGFMYAFNNLAQVLNLSPTTRDLARFDINRRFRSRMIGRMLLEVRKEAAPALLDEATIAELHGIDEERIMPELKSRLEGLRATSMLIDRNNLFWLGFDGAGLFVVDAKMNTGDFFFKAIGPYIDKDGMPVAGETKYRYYMVSERANVLVESEDMLQGQAQYLGAWWGGFKFYPLKTWINRCSHLRDDDWHRIAGYIGRAIPPKAVFEFISVLGSDPYVFIPCIHNGDIPDLARHGDDTGRIDDDEEFIKTHEIHVLPKLFIDPMNVIETYPANHPETRINEKQRELPVESTFDDPPSH
ncbi:MAG: hypothetical protein GQF41_4280 [Candidatus Rifleibacterium amylolyticum]|nr:MAG: hypothetical protein GQF41_4280 [Candidatus Rifleibacterium amylolyticum]